MKKIMHTGRDARALLRQGINLAADSVAFTLGPKGRNVSIARQSTSPKITNDGSTILQAISVKDPTVQMGVDFVKEVSRLVELEAYDGTTTSALLARTLINDCLDKIDTDSILGKDRVNPMAMKREIEAACAYVVTELRKRATKISSREDILKAALVAVENESLATIITDVFMEIGKDGIILVEEGQQETTYEVVKGMEIPVGLPSEDYGDEVVVPNASVLVSLNDLKDIKALIPVIQSVADAGDRELVIVAKSFSKELMQDFLKMHVTGEFTVYPVRSTIPDKTHQMHDIASFTGAVVLDQTHKLGRVATFKMTKDKSLFIEGRGDTSAHVTKLADELKSAKTEFDKEVLQTRISSLSGGVAVISVGAPSQVERGYLKDKLDDAVQSVRGAIREGVVKGGGTTLYDIANDSHVGILANALKAPRAQIIENGTDESTEGVIDGLPVALACVRNACSVAGIVITTELTIALDETTETKAGDLDA